MAGLLSAVELLKVAAGAAEEAVEMEIERRIDGEGLKAAAVKSESSVPWVVAAAEVVVVVAAGVREAREQLDGVGVCDVGIMAGEVDGCGLTAGGVPVQLAVVVLEGWCPTETGGEAETSSRSTAGQPGGSDSTEKPKLEVAGTDAPAAEEEPPEGHWRQEVL
eukprot:gene4986-6075_t